MCDHLARLQHLFSRGTFPPDAFFIDEAFRDRPLVIYGAGESFHYFKEVVIRQYGYTPSVVLDRRFAVGDTPEGVPTYSPDAYQPTAAEQRDAVVVVCLGNQSYYDDVFQTVSKMGFRNIIALNDIYEIHNPFCLPLELEANGFQYYLENRERVEACLELFADDRSKEVYLACLETHLTRKPVKIPMCPRHEQYTPQEIPMNRGYDRFLYCGVSVGEMAGVFSRTGKIEELVCFEPDPNQFKLTTEWLVTHKNEVADRVTAIPCAVYSSEGIKPFTFSDTSFGSRILPDGDAWVQAVAIDHVLPNFNPTIITMDIEGAELEALKGAEQTIRLSRPDLAICVYHSPAHLWEIPSFIDSLGLGYKFYLRNYTSFVSETVLYAVTNG